MSAQMLLLEVAESYPCPLQEARRRLAFLTEERDRLLAGGNKNIMDGMDLASVLLWRIEGCAAEVTRLEAEAMKSL